MIRVLVVMMLLCAGCGDNPQETDQCMRIELFNSCLKALPAGPASTKYNDWDEAVEACSIVAYRMAQRKRDYVKPECRT